MKCKVNFKDCNFNLAGFAKFPETLQEKEWQAISSQLVIQGPVSQKAYLALFTETFISCSCRKTVLKLGLAFNHKPPELMTWVLWGS